MKVRIILPLLAVSQALLLVSCSDPMVKVLVKPIVATPVLDALLSPDKLTGDTKAYLKERNLYKTYQRDPDLVMLSLSREDRSAMSSVHRIALVELCSNAGDRAGVRDVNKAVGYHLAAADLSLAGALVSVERSKAETEELVVAYNHSVGRVAKLLFDTGHSWDRTASFNGLGKTYQLRSRLRGNGRMDPRFFDEMNTSGCLAFHKIDLDRKVSHGVGAAMVGHRKGTAARRKANPFLSAVGMTLPVNATLDFSNGGGQVELVFHDLTLNDKARLAGRSRPLAADWTAPLALLYNFKDSGDVGFKGMMRPDKYLDREGLYQLEPYRQDQIPLVLVHGLKSTPETWLHIINGLRTDPVLRDRYQILLYMYPTGYPVARNGAGLRKRLKQFQHHYDPNRRNPRMRNMILVGHSMGGLLSNAQIRTSGDSMTSILFNKPIDELEGFKVKEREELKELLIYKASPDITRAVFIAAPHRGSKLAKGPLGNLGVRLIKFPFDLLTAVANLQLRGVTDAGRAILAERPDSIKSLKPHSPGLMALLKQPVRRGVVYHSIIGNHKMKQPLAESSDTVVPYWSSHLDGAVSEKVVDADHNSITHDAITIEEMRRILYLHAGLSSTR